MDVVNRLALRGGAARFTDLVNRPADRVRLAELVDAGRVVDHGGGCYAVPDAPLWLVRARQFRGLLTCVSWAEAHRLAVLEPDARTHLAVPSSRSPSHSRLRPRGAVVLHRTGSGMARDDARPVTTPAEAMACVVRCLDRAAAVVTIDAALHLHACTPEQVRDLLRGPGSARARMTLAACDARSESPLESLARLALRGAGFRVQPGVRVVGVGLVDLLVEDVVVVELDGLAHHGDRRQFAEDRRRDRVLAARGFTVLRFTYGDVVHRPTTLVLAVREALAARAGRAVGRLAVADPPAGTRSHGRYRDG